MQLRIFTADSGEAEELLKTHNALPSICALEVGVLQMNVITLGKFQHPVRPASSE